jgi:hypothetical protein
MYDTAPVCLSCLWRLDFATKVDKHLLDVVFVEEQYNLRRAVRMRYVSAPSSFVRCSDDYHP